MDKYVEISGRKVGAGFSVFIIAEMSANHQNDYDKAVALMEAAKAAGADAIKLQTYTADTITLDCDTDIFRVKGTLWEGRSLHDLYSEASTPWEWQPRLKEVADALGLIFFSTPFDDTAVDFLEEMAVPCHKIASFEIVDLPLIRKVAATGKPVIMSTGMASEDEIREAIDTFQQAEGNELVLLKCTSAYPAPLGEMNLKTIPYLAETFDVPAGLSDHTIGHVAAVTAVALGACVIEKHLCLDRTEGGPDSSFSSEPDEFKAMVESIRQAEKAVGDVSFVLSGKQEEGVAFRRSLFVVQDICAGEEFTLSNVRSIRPGHGLHTRHLDELIGRRATKDIKCGTPMSWDLVVG